MPDHKSAAAERMAWPVSREELLLASLLCPSSWEPLIQAGLRSAVLRCPRRCDHGESERECSSPGHWRAAGPREAIRDERSTPGSATSEGEAWRSITDVWECSRCGATTRNPRIGQVSGMADCSWRGKGRLSHGDGGATEDALNELCDLRRRNGYRHARQEPTETSTGNPARPARHRTRAVPST